jgi:hypothetical protein
MFEAIWSETEAAVERFADEPETDPVRDWAEKHYNRCHPDDSFVDLARRASFSKEDRRLMQDWLAAARRHLGK